MKKASAAEKERLLVVDDDAGTLEVLQRNLASRGYRVYAAPGVAQAIEILNSTPVDLVITDLKMPKVSGLDLIRHVRENFREIEIMMITGYASIEGAVRAVKTGAEEYLAKPFTDEELFAAVGRSLEKLRVRRSAQAGPAPGLTQAPGIISEAAAMREVFDVIGKASATVATVLICGESGTGKELVARAIHYGSSRAASQFVPVNCSGIPEGLLESELFGHLKGAFTGASETRAGFFQTADGGTIFLDEIGDTSLAMQAKLLRVLQNKEVTMVGSAKTRKVDVRVLAATNKDLIALVAKGAFREDLYFRLNVITLTIPPLRERGDDVLLLAHAFAKKYAKEHGKIPPQFSDGALQVLKNYDWPGNVRELENVVQRLVVMSDQKVIEVPDLPSPMRFSVRSGGFDRTLAEMEAEYVRNVLTAAGGNKTRAAQILGIDRKTLREKLKLSGD
jgi:DNA-binding NtrC family response regulator